MNVDDTIEVGDKIVLIDASRDNAFGFLRAELGLVGRVTGKRERSFSVDWLSGELFGTFKWRVRKALIDEANVQFIFGINYAISFVCPDCHIKSGSKVLGGYWRCLRCGREWRDETN